MTELGDDEILKRAEEIKERRNFDKQIEALPDYLQGGTVVGWKKNPRFYIHDFERLTHEISFDSGCVFVRELWGESCPFIMVSSPDPESAPKEYGTQIYIPDHLNIYLNWGDGGKKGDVRVIINSDEFPVEVILKDSEKCMKLTDEREK